MTFMTDGIEMDARMQGGLLGGLKRKLLAGESLFLTFFKCAAASGKVAFSGEGFILERCDGSGEIFAHSGGTIVPFELKAGEKLKVDTGCLVAFDPTVDYDIEFVGGIKTAVFGGEGLFFAAMTGPGRVWVQTLPFSRLADRIMSAFHGSREETRRGDLGGALGALGDIISGDS